MKQLLLISVLFCAATSFAQSELGMPYKMLCDSLTKAHVHFDSIVTGRLIKKVSTIEAKSVLKRWDMNFDVEYGISEDGSVQWKKLTAGGIYGLTPTDLKFMASEITKEVGHEGYESPGKDAWSCMWFKKGDTKMVSLSRFPHFGVVELEYRDPRIQ